MSSLRLAGVYTVSCRLGVKVGADGAVFGLVMGNVMTWQGHSARVEYDDEDGIFFGRLAGIRDGASFHADTVDGRRAAFHAAVADYLETCARIGKEPQRAFSGQMMFRVNPEVHRRAVIAAELSGKSLNQWPEEVLGKAAG